MKKALFRFFTISWCLTSFITNGQVDRRLIEEVKIDSKMLKETRPVLISKPTAYDESTDSYFVIYVLDGNLNTPFTAGICELLYQSGFPKMMVVGIPNTNRARDLTPSADEHDAIAGGGADNFLLFLEKELLPYVDQNFRTHAFKVLIGHSWGGLFAVHTFSQKPEIFNGYIAITPTIIHNDYRHAEALKNRLRSAVGTDRPFFFSVGQEPGAEGDGVFNMRDWFEDNAPLNMNWEFQFYRRENHSTTPLIATIDGLRFIFSDLVIPNELVAKEGLHYLIRYYVGLKQKYGVEIKIPQRVMMNYGYALMEENRNDEAIDLFEHFSTVWPASLIPYDALSYIYESQGDKKEAIRYIKKTLEVAPWYQEAKLRLAKLNQ